MRSSLPARGRHALVVGTLAPLLPLGLAVGAAAPATADTAHPAYRFVVGGSAVIAGPQDEPVLAPLSVASDLSRPASAVPYLRPFVEGTQGAGIEGPAVSPDGRRIAFFLTDPDGYVVTGGTSRALVVMDVDGRNRRVVRTIPDYAVGQNADQSSWLDPSGGLTWRDGSTLVAIGAVPVGGSSANWVQVARTVDVGTGDLGTALRVGTTTGDTVDVGRTASGGGVTVASDWNGRAWVSTGGTPVQLSLEGDGGWGELAVSADGQHVAASVYESGSYRLVVLDRSGTTWTRRSLTTTDDYRAGWVRWLPFSGTDNARLVYRVGGDEQGHATYRIIDTAASVVGDRVVDDLVVDQEGAADIQAVAPAPTSGAVDVGVTATLGTAAPGGAWTGTLTVTNDGPTAATDTTVRVTGGATLTDPGAGVECSASTCTVASLPVGQTNTIPVSGTAGVTASVERVNITVMATRTDWDLSDNAVVGRVRVKVPATGGTASGRLIVQSDDCRDSTQPNDRYSCIYLVDADGTDRDELLRDDSTRTVQLVQADPAAGTFVWASKPTSGGGDATWHVARFDKDNTEVRSFPVSQITNVTLSPDGRTLAYTVDQKVWAQRVDVAGAQPRLLAEAGYQSGATNPRFSPDGTRVAYEVVSGLTRYTWVVDLDGRGNHGTPTRLPDSDQGWARHGGTPVWSPDGTKMAFAATERPGTQFDPGRILLGDVDGTAPARDLAAQTTAPGTPNEAPSVVAWSPDGSRVLSSNAIGSYFTETSTTDSATLGHPTPGSRALTVFYTGLAAITGGTDPDPDPDTTAPSVTLTASPAGALKKGGTLTLTVAAQDETTTGPLPVKVIWGDGTPNSTGNGTSTGTSFTHTFTKVGTWTVTVTAKDAAGNTGTATRQVVVDATPPKVAVGQPDCGTRTTTQCKKYRVKATAWTSARGTVSDAGGAGVGTVLVTAVEKRGSKYYALQSDGTWKKFTTAAAAKTGAARLTATVSGKSWSVPTPGVLAGALTLTATATDAAGNKTAAALAVSLK